MLAYDEIFFTLTNDREAIAAYIRISTHPIAKTSELSGSVYVDVDANAKPIDLEIRHAASPDLSSIPALPETAAQPDPPKLHRAWR